MPASRCGGCPSSPTTRTPSPPPSPTPPTLPAAPVRSPPRSSSSTSPATSPGPTSTSPPPATRRPTPSSGPRGRPASGPAPCSPGSPVLTRSRGSSGGDVLARPLLLGHEQPVADRQQDRHERVVGGDVAAEGADHGGGLVARGGLGNPVVPQRVVEGHDPARPQEAEGLGEVGGVLRLVAVAEHQVVVAVGQPLEQLEGGAGGVARARRGNARVVEGLARQPLVLGLDVDGGED